MKQIAIALLLLTGACAPQLEAASPAGGVVKWANPGEAFPVAQQYCASQGKAARISGFMGRANGTTFDCVTPG